ncbi:unnamed protein product [Lactuca saligna]|uniref:Uncharacterized protein n=1 Tax=Lactuca saligna TaxID=75948 RepID=A0AA36DW04_LACSI|nr:unnamed protein product [Lactuca saligna]
MFHDVPSSIKILEGYMKLTPFGAHPLTPELQTIIAKSDKPKKGERQTSRKRKTPTPSESADSEFDTQSDIRNEEEHNREVHIEEVHNEEVHHEDVHNDNDIVHNEEQQSNPEVTPIINDFVPSPPPSPNTTSILITITPCPPPISTQILPFICLFQSSLNPHPHQLHKPHLLFLSTHQIRGMEYQDDFQGFTFSPFTIRTEVDDDVPVMKGQLQAIHDKLDSLLQASKPSDDYSQASVKSILKTLTKEHSSNLARMNNVVDGSTKVYNEMIEKVDKLISDTWVFMENFQQSFDSNIVAKNQVISSLSTSLKSERAKFLDIRNGLKGGHEKFQSCISSQLSNLQDVLAIESKVMDVLAMKTEKVKTLSLKLEHSKK